VGQKPKKEIICYCNNIERSVIENAIRNGATTLNKIFDSTTAGIGSCGGSCRVKLHQMLESFLKDGTFPEKIIGKK
jgi:bacterioferritin-associated ferredoxin